MTDLTSVSLEYAGEQITKLRSWLEQATVRCEAPLLRALRSIPLPWATTRHQRLLAGAELEPLRSDGYRTLVRASCSRLFALSYIGGDGRCSNAHGVPTRLHIERWTEAMIQLL